MLIDGLLGQVQVLRQERARLREALEEALTHLESIAVLGGPPSRPSIDRWRTALTTHEESNV